MCLFQIGFGRLGKVFLLFGYEFLVYGFDRRHILAHFLRLMEVRGADCLRPIAGGIFGGARNWHRRKRRGCGPVSHFEWIQRGKMRLRGQVRIKSNAVHVIHLGHLIDFVHQGAGIGFASTLKVGIKKKIHGVKLVAFTSHVHGRRLASGGDGREVGIDVVRPQADSGKDVRRHVQRMRCGRRDLRVAACGGDAQLRQLRLIVTVDQIVRHAGMIRLDGEESFENRGGLLAVCERCIFVRLGSEQRERIERGRFVIVRIGLVHLLHRLGVGFGAGLVVGFF